MQNRRSHRTPFTVNGAEIFCANGFSVAIVASPELAAFICRACNNFDSLLTAAIACRSELMSNLTHPIQRPLVRDLIDLIDKLERE